MPVGFALIVPPVQIGITLGLPNSSDSVVDEMRRVLVRPSEWNYKLQNRMFSEGYCYQGLYSRAFGLWRERSKEAGFLLDTWDMHPLAEADVVWYNDLPHRRSEVLKARAVRPAQNSCYRSLKRPLSAHIFSIPRIIGILTRS